MLFAQPYLTGFRELCRTAQFGRVTYQCVVLRQLLNEGPVFFCRSGRAERNPTRIDYV